MFQRRIDGDERVSATAKQHPARILRPNFLRCLWCAGEVEVSRLHQMIANTTHHLRVVAIHRVREREFRWLACAGCGGIERASLAGNSTGLAAALMRSLVAWGMERPGTSFRTTETVAGSIPNAPQAFSG